MQKCTYQIHVTNKYYSDKPTFDEEDEGEIACRYLCCLVVGCIVGEGGWHLMMTIMIMLDLE